MLQTFYHEQAQKFSDTRQQPRPEFDEILRQIHILGECSERKQPLRIVELWCGDGRFARFLAKYIECDYKYVWVDFAQGQINLANKKCTHDGHTFVCADMYHYLTIQSQESIDVIVSVASIQHIMDRTLRIGLIKHIYRVLTYGWVHVSTNWCMSRWFKSKFRVPLLYARCKWFFSFGRYEKYNVLIPFITEQKTYQRPYHIFTEGEWQAITKKSWLIVRLFSYVTKSGNMVYSPTNARNSFIVQQKSVAISG